MTVQTTDLKRKQVYEELKNTKKGFLRWLTFGWCGSLPDTELDLLVVQVEQSNTTAIHDEFYRDQLQEVQIYKPDENDRDHPDHMKRMMERKEMDEYFFGQPVQVYSVRIDWIMQMKGKDSSLNEQPS